MKRIENRKVIKNDAFVIRVWDKKEKKILSQGKRVSKGSPLTAEERKVYVKDGLISLIKHIKDKKGWTLRQTADFMREIGLMEKKEWKYGSKESD